MNESIKQLAEEAGFCFWADESWKPAGAEIDWSSNYDKEFERFLHLLKRELLDSIDESQNFYTHEDATHYLRTRISQLLGHKS